MSLMKWIEALYVPSKTNLRDAGREDLEIALNDPSIRRHWLNAMEEELRAINVGVDRSLAEGTFNDIASKADRRRAILFCLNQILDSRTAIDNERFESMRDNQPSPFDGVAVQRE